MSILPPEPGEPRRPHGPRDPGDAWVVAPTGERYWGRFGAAGLAAVDRARGVLLQHRVGWSHHGGTWALPGGALHQGESPIEGAEREAAEEAGVPGEAVAPRFSHVFDAGVWRYTTVVADVTESFEAVISDPESLELAWVPVDSVDGLPLHPAFAAAWPELRAALGSRPALLIDAANVVGSVPDGWWRDRAGAAARLRDRLEALAASGIAASELGLPLDRWFPGIVMIVEGAARAVADGDTGNSVAGASSAVQVAAAPGAGDDELVRRAERMRDSGLAVTAVTSDRALRSRLEAAGARVNGAGWLLSIMDGADRAQ